MNNTQSILILLIILLVSIYLFNRVQCIDGDTFKQGLITYRLSYIDTPEFNEATYNAAKNYTCQFLKNGFKLKKYGKDKYQRTLVVVSRNNKNLNEELIKSCLAIPFYGKTTNQIIKLYDDRCTMSKL